jgi:hypothetical protein
MRFVSVRLLPFAGVLAIIYGVIGLTMVPTLLLTGAKEMILLVGILAPLFHFNVNLHLAPPSHFLTGVLSTVAASVCYAVTGWLTGAAAVLTFNFVARLTGGIEASLFVKEAAVPETPASRPS